MIRFVEAWPEEVRVTHWHNTWAGAISRRSFIWRTPSNAISMPRCAGWSDGVSALSRSGAQHALRAHGHLAAAGNARAPALWIQGEIVSELYNKDLKTLEHIRAQHVNDCSAVRFGCNQPCPLQHCEVLRDGRFRQCNTFDECSTAARSSAQ